MFLFGQVNQHPKMLLAEGVCGWQERAALRWFGADGQERGAKGDGQTGKSRRTGGG